jgi:hypothetical protein
MKREKFFQFHGGNNELRGAILSGIILCNFAMLHLLGYNPPGVPPFREYWTSFVGISLGFILPFPLLWIAKHRQATGCGLISYSHVCGCIPFSLNLFWCGFAYYLGHLLSILFISARDNEWSTEKTQQVEYVECTSGTSQKKSEGNMIGKIAFITSLLYSFFTSISNGLFVIFSIAIVFAFIMISVGLYILTSKKHRAFWEFSFLVYFICGIIPVARLLFMK